MQMEVPYCLGAGFFSVSFTFLKIYILDLKGLSLLRLFGGFMHMCFDDHLFLSMSRGSRIVCVLDIFSNNFNWAHSTANYQFEQWLMKAGNASRKKLAI